MPNPYTNFYMPSGFDNQDQQGLAPVFQNIAAQQANQNAALQQGNELAQQSSLTNQGSGFNNLAMAMALRNKQQPGTGEMYNSFGKIVKDPTYGAGTAYNNMTANEIANMQQYGV